MDVGMSTSACYSWSFVITYVERRLFAKSKNQQELLQSSKFASLAFFGALVVYLYLSVR